MQIFQVERTSCPSHTQNRGWLASRRLSAVLEMAPGLIFAACGPLPPARCRGCSAANDKRGQCLPFHSFVDVVFSSFALDRVAHIWSSFARRLAPQILIQFLHTGEMANSFCQEEHGLAMSLRCEKFE